MFTVEKKIALPARHIPCQNGHFQLLQQLLANASGYYKIQKETLGGCAGIRQPKIVGISELVRQFKHQSLKPKPKLEHLMMICTVLTASIPFPMLPRQRRPLPLQLHL